MSTDLVSTIMQSLSSETIGKVSSCLGLEQSTVQRGITAAIPAILGALANSASNPAGVHKLGNALSDIEEMQGADVAKNLTELTQGGVVETGWTMMSSLIGANSLETLSSAVAQFAGFGQGPAKKLLGFLVPVVLGLLRREQVDSRLDSRGIANLLTSQRGNIERAMPASIARRLKESEVRPAVLRQTTASGGRQATAGNIPSQSSGNWAYWLLPALILAGAALYLLPARDDSRTVQEINQSTTAGVQQASAKETAQVAPPAQRELQPAPVSTSATIVSSAASTPATLENDILANISRLRAALQTVKDPASAQAALGELKAISDRFGRLKSVAQQLSPESRKALATAIANRVPDLNGLIDRIGSEFNLSGDAKPAMDTLKSDLASLSKA
jgi:hypothetical protein